MGHIMDYGFLDATTKEGAMREGLEIAQEFAYHNVDRYENPSGSYHNNFRFYDRVFNTVDEALDFFRDGFYKDGVCLVKDSSGAKKRYQEKINKINQKEKEFKQKVIDIFKERASATVSCKECESRYTKEVALRFNLRCPVCNNWMVSNTVLESYKRFSVQREDAEKQYRKDCADTGKARYFYKVEVHC